MDQTSTTSKKYYRRRMTSVGRFSMLSETKGNPSVPVMVLALSGKRLNAEDFVKLYYDRNIGTRHERFRSTTDDFTNFKVVPEIKFQPPVTQMLSYPLIYRTQLKNWITDALLEPMDLSKSLWEANIFTGGHIGQSGAVPMSTFQKGKDTKHSVESLIIFRCHHVMADGVSLGTIFSDLMDEHEDFQNMIKMKLKAFQKHKKSFWKRLQFVLYYWCWGSIKAFAYQFYLYWADLISRLTNSNPWILLRQQVQNDDVSSESRTLSWCQATTLDEVKQVAAYFSTKTSRVTVNDVFCSCVTAAIAKLIHYHQNQHNDLNLSLPNLNLVMPVHMQGGILLPGQSLGNKIGAIVSRLPGLSKEDETPLSPSERLERVHQVLSSRKKTPAAFWSFLLAKFVGSVGFGGHNIHEITTEDSAKTKKISANLVPWIFEKAHANASVVVTNVRGPSKMVHLDGRRVEGSMGFLPLPSGIPIGVVVSSYANKLMLTVMAEPWAVPDADLFLSWIVEEYQTLKREAGIEEKDKSSL